MAEELVDALTPVTPLQMLDAMRAAWTEYAAEHAGEAAPNANGLLVLVAHWALETGYGRFMHCHNPGNAKSIDGDGFDFTFFACDEIINGKVVWYYPKSPGCRFRAFKTLAAGVAAYFRDIRARFANAWRYVLTGDVQGFGHTLKLDRYYTADENKYVNGLVAIVAELRTAFAWGTAYDLHAPKDEQRALNALGFGPLVEDGQIGPITTAAIRRFQKAHGLAADGVIGPMTIAEMAAALSALPH